MTDKEFFRLSMQLVIERAKALAIRRTYIHSENENRSQQEEKEQQWKQAVKREPLR